MTCLGFASRFNEPEIVHQLLRAEASVDVIDSEGRTPLHWACRSKVYTLEKVELLLRYDAQPNVYDYGNNTPVMYAACTEALKRNTTD